MEKKECGCQGVAALPIMMFGCDCFSLCHLHLVLWYSLIHLQSGLQSHPWVSLCQNKYVFKELQYSLSTINYISQWWPSCKSITCHHLPSHSWIPSNLITFHSCFYKATKISARKQTTFRTVFGSLWFPCSLSPSPTPVNWFWFDCVLNPKPQLQQKKKNHGTGSCLKRNQVYFVLLPTGYKKRWQIFWLFLKVSCCLSLVPNNGLWLFKIIFLSYLVPV